MRALDSTVLKIWLAAAALCAGIATGEAASAGPGTPELDGTEAAQEEVSDWESTRCGRTQARLERRLQRGRASCGRRDARLGARGIEDTFQGCEARQLAKYGRALVRAGCALESEGEPPVVAVGGGESGTALVEFHGQVVEVAYGVEDGLAIFEDDVVLGPVEEVRRRDAEIRSGRVARSATALGFGWKNNVIPFKIGSSVPPELESEIRSAVEHWNANTIVRLQDRNGEGDYVEFVKSTEKCSTSWIGKSPLGGRHEIQLRWVVDREGRFIGGCKRGEIVHEIGHIVGLFHEHTRNDRDEYVEIIWSNIKDDKEWNFQKYLAAGVDRRGFDFNSIMLYGSRFMAIDDSKPTMTKLNGDEFEAQLNGLSEADIAGVTMMLTNWDWTPFNKFRNEAASLCMGVDGASVHKGAKIEGHGFTGHLYQRWYIYQHPRTSRKLLINAKSGLCLEVPGGSTASGTDLQQNSCHGGLSQAFLFDGKFWSWEPWRIRNERSGLCLDLEQLADQGDLEQKICDGSSRQKWFQE